MANTKWIISSYNTSFVLRDFESSLNIYYAMLPLKEERGI